MTSSSANGAVPAVAYLRVSRTHQETEQQRAEILAGARQRGFDVVAWYEEKITGRTLTRPALDQLRADARSRKISLIVTWALDRLSRAGILDSLLLMRELEGYGVGVVSIKDPIPDPGTPHRDLVLSVLFWVSEQESRRRSERVKAALAIRREKGLRLGRKPRDVDLDRVKALRDAGRSWRSIARAMKVGKSTLLRAANRS